MSNVQYPTLASLFAKYPWRTYAKFQPLAARYGFTNNKEIKEFLQQQAGHDKYKPQGSRQLPIYSKSSGAYQFDTLVQARRYKDGVEYDYWLVFINVNTRKAYCYPMPDKSARSVLPALQKFKADCPDVRILTSDQDGAYLTKNVLDYLRQQNIDYRTTLNNNHNVLGIINRFIRTLRDLNGKKEFTNDELQDLVAEYNNSPHRGLKFDVEENGKFRYEYKTPNEMTKEDEAVYAAVKEQQFNDRREFYREGDRVRIVLEKNRLGKNRTNLSKEAYEVTGRHGNQWVIRAEDNSVDTYPGYRLVKCDARYQLAKTIKTGTRKTATEAVVEKIVSYNPKNDKYRVKWEGLKTPSKPIPSKDLRTGRPLHVSNIERQYWAREPKNKLPEEIRSKL